MESVSLILARHDKSLAAQLDRATMSIVFDVGEGNRRIGKDYTHRSRVAAGSAAEVDAALEVATLWDRASDEQTALF